MSTTPLSPLEAEAPALPQDGVRQPPTAAQLRRIRWGTAAWCAALTIVAVAIHDNSVSKQLGAADSFWTFMNRENDTFGLLAAALAVITLPFGAFYGRGFAARLRIAPQARAMHMAISLSALAAIALHVFAIWSGSRISWFNVKALLIPFGYPDDNRFPYPIAAGVVGFWLIVIFGLSYFLRNFLGGAARWRIAHRVVLVAFALSVLHSIYLSGLLRGWRP